MNRGQRLVKWLIIALLVLVATLIFTYFNSSKVVSEQESQIEILKESNASLQQERDSVYEEYAILRDQLWNLNNSLERECSEWEK